jgi:hypothetical protein
VASTIPGQLLAAIKSRKFPTAGRLFAPGCDFIAWNPSGRWVASDSATIAKIFEVWFSPGANSTIVDSNETAGPKGTATVEVEICWKLPPEEQTRVLRQVYLLTVKGDRITHARIYCAGLHTDFPEVDLEKQRRSKGIGGPKLSTAPKMVAAKVN